MVVAHGEDYPPQAAFLQAKEKLFPAGGTLPVGHLHSEHLAPALPINADGHQYRSRTDYRALSELLIPRVENQIRILALELPTGKTLELLVQLLVESTDRARAKTVPTELFADRFDLPSRYSLDVHLR